MSTNPNVADRTPDQPVDLIALGSRLLEEARPSGTSALTLDPSISVLHQTVVALTAGSSLDPERWNGPASILVIDGAVRFAGDETEVESGTWASLPDDGHGVVATQDTYLLLTVGPTA